ncbi:hypothetical protein HK097_008807 [Rhizophlyctis rosea]|uniref:Myb-like domain-containing protein n=1 Tax=Rhizophlyctis rosea TaxID=64517 RepID=A0AAD5SPW3_9FUNG|nr:hypothetical protein HK097_008807 [Rhizophlyctis rosea]
MPPKRKQPDTNSSAGSASKKKQPSTSSSARAEPFSKEENELLEDLYVKYGGDWDVIYTKFTEARGRTKAALQKRWSNMMQLKSKKEAKEGK